MGIVLAEWWGKGQGVANAKGALWKETYSLEQVITSEGAQSRIRTRSCRHWGSAAPLSFPLKQWGAQLGKVEGQAELCLFGKKTIRL